MSDPDLDICSAVRLKGSPSAVSPEEDHRRALMLPSMLAVPPLLPPKRYQKSPTFEKTSTQGPQLKAFTIENKALTSQACHLLPILGQVKGNNQCLDLVPGKVPVMQPSCIVGILPEMEPKCQMQFSPRSPLKSFIKPTWPDDSKRDETEEVKERAQEADWRTLKEKMGDKTNRQEENPTERNEKTEGETSGLESHLDVGKPLRQILVSVAEEERAGEEGEDRGKEDEDHSNIGLNTPAMRENSSLRAMEFSDLSPGEEPDMASPNRASISTVPAKPELMIPPLPPPKPPRKYPPKQVINPSQLFHAMSAGEKEVKERRRQVDEQWSNKDLTVENKNEKEGGGKDRGKVNDTDSTTPNMKEMSLHPGEIVMYIPKSSANQEIELPGGGERFCLKPPCRNRLMGAENRCLHHEPQHPEKQHQNKDNGLVQPGPLPQDVLIWMDKMTENNKEIQVWGQGMQDSEVISKLPSGHQGGTEVVESKFDPCQLGLLEDTQETAETLLDGKLKQTSQKTNAKRKVKQLAKIVKNRLKQGRKEKRRVKVDKRGEDDIELTQDERRHLEEGGMKDEEKEEGMDELTLDRSVEMSSETQSQDLMERRIKRGDATSKSPFSSFKVSSPVKLVEELLSGDEWSQFLYRDQKSHHDPAPCHTHSDDTGQLSVNSQYNSTAELDLALDVFGNAAVPEESVYEDIDLHNVITEDSQTHQQQEMERVSVNTIPQIILESEANQMSLRTKDIYETVEFIQSMLPADTGVNFSDIKSQGVLDSAVQKYLIKLSKKRKHRAARMHRRDHSHETLGQSPSSTSPQVFPASIFYSIPASGREEQPSSVKSGGSSPRTKIKLALRDKTMPRTAQLKEDEGQ